MREIKFRGLGIDGKWWFGESNPSGENHVNLATFFANIHAGAIRPETVGEWIGLHDKNGKEIYEGDIVRIWDYGFKDDNEDNEFGLFRDIGVDKVTMERPPRFWLEHEEFGYEGEDLTDPSNCEIIGNQWENPKLLEP
ncbi:MAG: YopX family protein [Dehalococcoidia bacterium]|nr:YopX family protein [Dehalococcoidia bacterium]